MMHGWLSLPVVGCVTGIGPPFIVLATFLKGDILIAGGVQSEPPKAIHVQRTPLTFTLLLELRVNPSLVRVMSVVAALAVAVKNAVALAAMAEDFQTAPMPPAVSALTITRFG